MQENNPETTTALLEIARHLVTLIDEHTATRPRSPEEDAVCEAFQTLHGVVDQFIPEPVHAQVRALVVFLEDSTITKPADRFNLALDRFREQAPEVAEKVMRVMRATPAR